MGDGPTEVIAWRCACPLSVRGASRRGRQGGIDGGGEGTGQGRAIVARMGGGLRTVERVVAVVSGSSDVEVRVNGRERGRRGGGVDGIGGIGGVGGGGKRVRRLLPKTLMLITFTGVRRHCLRVLPPGEEVQNQHALKKRLSGMASDQVSTVESQLVDGFWEPLMRDKRMK